MSDIAGDNRPEVERTINKDPVTGETAFHPAGTATGAVAGGAVGIGAAVAAGVALGAVAGPLGMAAGAAIGAVAGGWAGKALAEQVNPSEEEAYWREHHHVQPYFDNVHGFEEYREAYRTGYEGRVRYEGRSFDEVEKELRLEYERNRDQSDLDWEEGSLAARASWNRVEHRYEVHYPPKD
ncbi:hypothetical protein IGB42_03419 [Andreprevotia sp. IGB-42]|uniref:hypothetical protein n=1 Tax=Andreprevotia sp. IGB-42 TaxID=2497473 RepID=UPI00135A2E33|nr:hypothetical protein [Andreprevotia sp. IGB-42]KAF0812142.1 hypothetical protein IGB42_03419 [Andreprevotia sp. IGB-42]